jgi:polyhydroxyalkanoate synthesis regulator phasin
VVSRSGKPQEDGKPGEAAAAGADGVGAGELDKEGQSALKEFREWLESSQRTIDDWQKKVDDRIRNVVEGISPFASLQKEVHALASRISELEEKLGLLAREEGKDRHQK